MSSHTRQTPEEHSDAIAHVVAKAWQDPSFKDRLKSNPEETLRAEGINLPEGASVTVHEESDGEHHFVIPNKPASWSHDHVEKRKKERVSPLLCAVCSI
jgi:hypothetical protein